MTRVRRALCRSWREEFAGFLGEIKQYGARIEHLDVAVDDRGQLRVWIDGEKFRLMLLAFACVDRNGVVGRTRLLKEQGDFGGIGGTAVVELQHWSSP
jgi:hypothetical protein